MSAADFVVGLGKGGRVVFLGGKTTASNWKKHFSEIEAALSCAVK